jgi:hypothetical protein
MAQTIQSKRGTVSASATGGWTTIFTQSAGVAARIVPINLEFWSSQSPRGETGYFQLAISSGSGGGQIISYLNVYGPSTTRGFQVPCQSFGAAGLQANSTQTFANKWTYSSSSSSSPYNSGITNVSQNIGVQNTQPENIGQFYMSNGDSLSFRCYLRFDSGKSVLNCTYNCNYDCIAITET